MTWDPEAFRKQFLEACDIADGVRTALEVRATPAIQGGREVLFGTCPRCKQVAALSGEGKHLCRRCRSWLRYVRDEKQQPVGKRR